MDTFAGAAETGQVRPELADGQIQSATLEMAGSGVGGDRRSPSPAPHGPRGNARHLGRGPARLGSRAFRERPGQGTSLAIDKVRPAVLGVETRTLLRRLGFRRFLRHAYAIDLDGARLENLRTCARAVLPLLSEDLKRFDEFLSDVGRE